MLKALVFASAAGALLAAPAAALTIDFDSDRTPADGSIAAPVVAGALEDGAAGALNERTDGALAQAMAAAEFTGEAGASLNLFGVGGYDRITLVGVGEGPLEARDLADFGGLAARGLIGAEDATILIGELPTEVGDPGAYAAYGAKLGAYRFDKYFEEEQPPIPDITIRTDDHRDARRAFESDLSHVATATAFARDLISEPGNVLYPETFVARVEEAFDGLDDVTVETLGPDEMAELDMGALLGVGQGSARPPRLLIVRYNGAGDDAPVAFVGKGVTFDTGGISLKNSSGMWRMKYDMSGAAAVVGAAHALAAREADVNAIAIAALAENMPGAGAQRPGDIVKTMSGKTVEVLNTDAEGRLLLADAVWYAQETFEPQALINLATLTGSVRVALGDDYAGLYSRHDDLAEAMIAAGEASGDEVWRMPLHPTTAEELVSQFADVKNVVEGGIGGANIGAQFVGTFVKPETRWAHLDIASTAWTEMGGPTTPPGAVGYGVRLLDAFVRNEVEGG
ncbi:MAG: leucyl aminopeptidase [Pseudomonadota bacterium]